MIISYGRFLLSDIHCSLVRTAHLFHTFSLFIISSGTTCSVKFFTLHSSLFIKMRIFAPDLASRLRAGWVKKTSMEHAPCMSLTVGLAPSQSHIRDIKDVFWTLSSAISNFANLIPIRKIPQRGVHVGCIISLCQRKTVSIQFSTCCISHYNTRMTWAG